LSWVKELPVAGVEPIISVYIGQLYISI
jgi:hypothetical protein